MNLGDLFRRSPKPSSASVAKERLQILVTHERVKRNSPDYLMDMEREIVAVIRKYVPIKEDDVQVQFDNHDNYAMLELNVTLPE